VDEKIMLTVKTKVDKSKIHGLGVFADQNIPKGTIVWMFKEGIDTKYTKEQFESMTKEQQKDIIHFSYYDINLNCYIHSFDDSRYVNHSDNPNLSSHYDEHYVEGYSYANRDIKIGEELTDDYYEYDGVVNKKFTSG
jgi:SET domain-containing protein